MLRSGLYFLRSPDDSLIYVVYWPQDTTWDDNAVSAVARNRVTFMRFVSEVVISRSSLSVVSGTSRR